MIEFTPKLFTAFRGYTSRKFFSDLMAGTIVGVVALPLAIAFGIASGVTPDRGLVTAIIAGFLISLLGGSRVQIGGPTGAFVVIVYGIVAAHGVDGLLLATMMAGVMLLIMGLARLGTVIRFIPHPLIVGFTTGIAVIIFTGQAGAFLGMDEKLPAEFAGQILFYARHLESANAYALGVGAGSLLITAGWRYVDRRIPGSLIALIAATVLVKALDLPVTTIGDRFGHLSASLPTPSLPAVDLERLRLLLPAAFTIAMLGAIESLLSAVVADGMTGFRHRPNAELNAQGLANIITPLLGGIPATGAIARTATNIKNGATTPLAGIVHSVVLLLILLLFGSLASEIPLSCLAGILMVVAYNMSEWRSFAMIFRSPRSDIAVLMSTFLLTLFVDLTVAIEVGLVLSALLFIRRVIRFGEVRVISRVEADNETEEQLERLAVPAGIDIYEIEGPFFFGVAHKFEEASRIIDRKPKVRILRLRRVPFIDGTGIHALTEFVHKSTRSGIRLVVSGVNPQPRTLLEKYGLFDLIGAQNIFEDFDDALAQAKKILRAGGTAPSPIQPQKKMFE